MIPLAVANHYVARIHFGFILPPRNPITYLGIFPNVMVDSEFVCLIGVVGLVGVVGLAGLVGGGWCY